MKMVACTVIPTAAVLIIALIYRSPSRPPDFPLIDTSKSKYTTGKRGSRSPSLTAQFRNKNVDSIKKRLQKDMLEDPTLAFAVLKINSATIEDLDHLSASDRQELWDYIQRLQETARTQPTQSPVKVTISERK